MGVHLYTHVMSITSTHTFSLSTIQQIDIDCSAVSSSSIRDEFAPLIQWVQTVPERSSVHVTLRSATGSISARKLKSVFQSLGCTVRMRTACPVQ